MRKQQTDYLIQLINSLSKGDKRSFRLYVNRDNSSDEKLFMVLFEFIDRYKRFDEALILKKNPRIKKVQLSNIKRNLYFQLLMCLRNLSKNTTTDIAIRENLDYAKILYSRGMYKASLDLLDKARKQAIQTEHFALAMTIINFERQIESQHITGSMFGKAEELKNLSEEILEKIVTHNELSNFSLMLYGYYLQYGYVKDKKDYRFVTEYFKNHHPKLTISELSFHEELLYYQSYVWYNNMIQDFPNYYRHAQSWVDLFHDNPEKKYSDTALYFKGLHNLLNALFMIQRLDKFEPVFEELVLLWDDKKIVNNQNNESLWTLFYYIHGIDKIYLTADYNLGAKYVEPLEDILIENKYQWDQHRVLVFYYKIACVYFGDNQLDKAIFYLNKITNSYYPDFRNDIQCFARILNLIAHFDLGNIILVSYQVKSVYRFLLKMEDLQQVQREIFKFIRKTPNMLEQDLIEEFRKLKDKLLKLKTDPFERRPFLYLDIISWLESKIKGISMQEAIKENLNSSVVR